MGEFDLCGPLPRGVTLLEASAGTGKTYTIAALAARYVAIGTPLEQMLLITFTRSATSELRDRVRERLVHYEQQLTRLVGGEPRSEELRSATRSPASSRSSDARGTKRRRGQCGAGLRKPCAPKSSRASGAAGS